MNKDMPDNIWITHKSEFPNQRTWYEHGEDAENYTEYLKRVVSREEALMALGSWKDPYSVNYTQAREVVRKLLEQASK